MGGQLKYYKSSDGTMTLLNEMEFTHLSNGFAKKCREIFNSKDKEEFSDKMIEIDDIKEELYKRMNEFLESLDEQ